MEGVVPGSECLMGSTAGANGRGPRRLFEKPLAKALLCFLC